VLPTASADTAKVGKHSDLRDRGMGTSAVTVSKAGGGAAVVTLAKEPVNSMNLDLWRQLQGALDQCEQDPEVCCPTRSGFVLIGPECHDIHQRCVDGCSLTDALVIVLPPSLRLQPYLLSSSLAQGFSASKALPGET